jgi:muramoyltetrapeptide carboxypeptidase
MSDIFPKHIKHIAIIAPAGSAAKDKIYAGADLLQSNGLNVTIMPHVFSSNCECYLAADVNDRVYDLHQCWHDTSVDLILCARGGFGSAHLLPLIDWELLRSRRLPVIGYSDITALHLAMLKNNAGIPIVAPMAAKLTEALIENSGKNYTAQYLYAALSGETTALTPPEGKSFCYYNPGAAFGYPVAANLAVLSASIGTPYFPSFKNKILIIEDLNEPIYKLDRYLTQLFQAGVLQECAGLILGEFIDCGSANELERLFVRIAQTLPIPVLSGFPFSHALPLASLRMDMPISISDAGEIIINCKLA